MEHFRTIIRAKRRVAAVLITAWLVACVPSGLHAQGTVSGGGSVAGGGILGAAVTIPPLAFVQGKAVQCTSVATCSVTLTSATTAGNTLLVAVSTVKSGGGGQVPRYVYDCSGAGPCTSTVDSWALDGNYIPTNQLSNLDNIARATYITGASQQTVTVGLNATASYFSVLVAEFQGVSIASPIDGSPGTFSSTSAQNFSCSMTTSYDNDLTFGYGGGGATITASSPSSVAAVPAPTTGDVSVYRLQTTHGTNTVSYTQTSSATSNALCQAYRTRLVTDVSNYAYWPTMLTNISTALSQSQAWETVGIAPHYFSVANFSTQSMTYSAWYGLYGAETTNAACGLASSNDLTTWTKYASNPVITNCRWPSVINESGNLTMAFTYNYMNSTPGSSEIHYATSTDGITWTTQGTLVPAATGFYNQNPNLYLNPNDGNYYLYYFHGDGGTTNEIHVRSASTVAGLASASDSVVASSSSTLAAPNIYYYNGYYYLSVEIFPSSIWKTQVYRSSSPASGFTLLSGNPVAGNAQDQQACATQFTFGSNLYVWYCDKTTSTGTWTIVNRVIPLTQPLLVY